MNRTGITLRQSRELDFIRANPGRSKEFIVKGMNGDPTRIPILNDLKDLEREGLIVLRKDKPNSAFYRIYLNEDDPKSSLFQELSSFKEYFVRLLQASIKVFDEYENEIKNLDQEVHWPVVRRIIKHEDELLRGFFTIYIFMVKLYSVVRIFQWHKNISDPEVISNLYLMAFDTLEEIQVKVFELQKTLFVFGEYKDNEIFSQMFGHGDEPNLPFFSKIYGIFQRYNLGKEFEPLMNILWSISLELIPFQDYRQVLKLKNKDRRDWKSILIDYRMKFNHGRQSWMA